MIYNMYSILFDCNQEIRFRVNNVYIYYCDDIISLFTVSACARQNYVGMIMSSRGVTNISKSNDRLKEMIMEFEITVE